MDENRAKWRNIEKMETAKKTAPTLDSKSVSAQK
jgi:hypothetical protein